ncbi:hypothetical protein ASC75_16130 [Aminobacter sp. DSM 101952]|uniref:type II toxin-antitoxin system RelE/ParE family toxin n=1 Tax=Aminobacter sp. DSM 101952 TaxID=2735891 RepID=UPI0006F66BC4|nr:type II toxin-antitoxin system RelE/ParE family toxin [Aminobacter sp. DSM 101952]KQU62709.1 hypothetical protein ASC75_16130 [Aminobacter sp. DSM 101952]
MKVVFLPSAGNDVLWFFRYYRTTFPEGRGNARKQMAKTLAILQDQPHIGHPVHGAVLREHPITRTPFSVIYRVADDRIEILRLWDGRGNPDRLKEPIEGMPSR